MVPTIKRICARYSHAWTFLYWLIYLPWFSWLEHTVTEDFHILQFPFDEAIPFCEIFVIPYLLWFPFVGMTILWFFFHDKKEYYQLIFHLYAGMTLFLVLCTVFPNGVDLRPDTVARDNFLVTLTQAIWAADTPTNVFPSLHVFNSFACCAAILRCPALREKRALRRGIVVLTVLIMLAAVFLRQHSILDVAGGIAIAWGFYALIYRLPHKSTLLCFSE